MKRLTAVVQEKDEGRLIKFFVRSELGVSYHQFAQLKEHEGMRVNGQIVHANYPLATGDKVEICLRDSAETKVIPEEGPLAIVYEDEDLYIIDKPAPLACQCSSRQPINTLENRLAWHNRNEAGFVFRPINRLDKGTSGLMAVAKHAHSYQLLQKQLHTDAFVREYLAVAEGILTGEGTINLPIAKQQAATVRRVVDFQNGKDAVTHYRALEHGNGRTLVRLRLETGRTHQIRVHLAHIGHPIAGDFLYGTEIEELPGRFALHSAHIELNHPILKMRIVKDSSLPPELNHLLESL